MSRRYRYYITTWDMDKQEFTPQRGVRTGPHSLFGLRSAVRQLREYGYGWRRDDFSIYVHRVAKKRGRR